MDVSLSNGAMSVDYGLVISHEGQLCSLLLVLSLETCYKSCVESTPSRQQRAYIHRP